MATQDQEFIDGLILTIEQAEDPESVTNSMVAAVMDYLNKSYKDLLTNNQGVKEEKAERQAADAALQRTIDTVNLALQTIQKTTQSVSAKADLNEQRINTLINGDGVTAAIDTFNELKAFLEGVTNKDTFMGLLNEIRESLQLNRDDINLLKNEAGNIKADADELGERVETLEGVVIVDSVATLDNITNDGIYFLSVAGQAGNIMIVRSATVALSPGNSTVSVTQYMFTPAGLEYRTKVYTTAAGVDGVEWPEWQQVGQKGAGNLINVDEIAPKASGYYDIISAAEAIPTTLREFGRWITFKTGPGAYITKQFTGSTLTQWNQESAWSDTGGRGTITGVTLNGEKIAPDAEGVVNIAIDETAVDDSFSPTSTNPVQNKVINARLEEIERRTLQNLDASLNEDGTEIHISAINSKGDEFTGVDIPVSSGGGGDDTSSAKVIISAAVNKSTIREGDAVTLSYSYDHQYLGGDMDGVSTGQRGAISIEIKNGTVVQFSTTVTDFPAGSDSLDITKFLKAGTNDITIKAVATNPDTGKTQQRTVNLQVRAYTLGLTSSYSLANSIAGGGYKPDSSAIIPFTVNGSAEKTVTLYLDGVEYNSTVIKKSGKTNGSFTVPMSSLSIGRHNVQIVAEMQANDLTLVSESIFIDILKCNALGQIADPFIGSMIIFPDGRIFDDSDYLTPVIEVGQFERMDFDFVVYDPATTPAEMAILHNGVQSQGITAPRTVQKYTNRFTQPGEERMQFCCGVTSYDFTISIVESSITLAEVTDHMTLKLSAAGRSNNEANPAHWEFEGITTTFNGFDWSTNGWDGEALCLSNGASIDIDARPFASDATATGLTIEAEIKCTNVADRSGIIMECMAAGVGLNMTAEEASLKMTGGAAVQTKFAPDMWLKIAFVVQSKADNRLLQLYVNGIRDRAEQYDSAASLMHPEPQTIRIASDAADVEVRNIRIYSRALTDDEILSNYMVDRPDTDDMVLLFQRNDVLNDETDEIDIDKLRAQGKAVMRIVGDVDLVNQTNNKKFEVPVDVYYYSPYGKEYDFVAFQIGLRIQGTSSTTYPRKNYRLYFYRPDAYEGCRLVVNGVEMPDFKYSFKPGARPVSIFCLKADFSDSSSVHNSGAVRIVNEVFKRCGWLTPPQAAYKGEYDVRIGVDALPLNLFYDNNGTGVATFLGKYNFNNEKSESHDVYGFEGIEGFNDAETLDGQRNKCICLEFLDNSHSLCLFGTSNMADFDKGLEFRFKPDQEWATADQEDRDAVTRLWAWVQSCKGNPSKFLREYKDYFLNDSPYAWYVLTDYFMAVDNRAKNMMLATWDGIHWMFLPYDMDTLWGVRNDSRLVFDYMTTFDTKDDTQDAYCFAGHDSVLWELVRDCPEKLAEVARTLRANMSTEYVLQVVNDQFMNEWSERVYNKDGEYKYILPLIEQGRNYLYALQGSRFAHRSYIITNRFALLDSLYCAGTYRADAFSIYLAYQFASDPRTLQLTASERFCFGYGMTNGDPTVSGLIAENAGDEIVMTFRQNLIVNDPQNIYGASRIQTMNLTDISHAIVGNLNLNNCIRLQELDASCANGQNMLTGLMVNGCRNLRKLNVNGLRGLSALDLLSNKQLDTFKGQDTELANVAFAPGGKLAEAELPASLQTLELRYLAALTDKGLKLASADNITRLVVDSCPGIDWRALMARCANCQYLRITGLNMTGNGDFLKSLLTMRGVDEMGANVNTCRLTGRYQLTKYLPDDEFNALVAHFPELNILQPEWTVIKFTESVSDPANVSNMDNETGYEFDRPFEASAHVARIMAKRHRVMAKCTAPGEMTVCPLSDDNSLVYHDGTPANLEGFNSSELLDEGDVMIYEVGRWCKGIDDFINRCHYDCYSSLDKVTDLTAELGRKLYLGDLEVLDKKAVRVSSAYSTLEDSLMDYDTFRVMIAPVAGFKQVRWPAVASSVYGAVFLDIDDNVISRAAANHSRMTDQSYLFTNVPEGAEKIAFTCYRNVEFSFVWMTISEEIQAIEPDPWETGDYLVGVYKAHYLNTQIRSISGVLPTVNISQSQFAEYCRRRGEGYCLINYQMHRDFARLFFAVKGTRDSSGACGYGSGSNYTLTGLTNALGMQDTIAPTTIGVGGCFYIDSDGNRKSIASLNALGMENAWGNVAEWMEGVTSDYLVWNIEDANDGPRKVKSGNINDSWIIELANGRNMDVVPVTLGGTETTHYCDKAWCNNSPARVVCRASSNAYSSAGVASASTTSDAAGTNAWYGSRLAFIGKIIYTLDVQAFKALEAIA